MSKSPSGAHQVQCALWAARLMSHLRPVLAPRFDAWSFRRALELVGVPPGRLPAERTLAARRRVLAQRATGETPLEANVRSLGAAVGLSPVERDLLAFGAALPEVAGLRELVAAAEPLSPTEGAALLAAAVDRPVDEVVVALSPEGTLARSGLVQSSSMRDAGQLEVTAGVGRALRRPHADAESLLASFACPIAAPDLAASDFPHLAEDLGRMTALMRHALDARVPGVGVLLHGPPGSGKTQLGRLLAREIGARGYEVPIDDDDGDALTGPGRLLGWRLSQQILSCHDRAMLVFDEFDDAFGGGEGPSLFFGPRRGPSKGWIHRALEEARVPTVWIANGIEHLDPAHLRRFSLVVEVRNPPRVVRRRILDAELGDLEVGEAWRDRQAADARLSPAIIRRAGEVARLIPSAGPSEVERTLDAVIAPHVGAPGGRRSAPRRLPARYDPSLLNTTEDLEALCEGLAGATRATLCLYGPPGTGKTLWVHHLASRLGRHVVTRRGSDLLSMWVGQSERQVADAFREAVDDPTSLLFLDEVESFLMDRRGARASWEVSLTNELLGWLDHAEALVVAATNHLALLDPAVLRRFDLKVGFDALRPEQRGPAVRSALERLGVPDWPVDAARRASRLEGLTLGDLEAAARHCELTRAQCAARVLDVVERELAVKKRVAPVGFVQAGSGR